MHKGPVHQKKRNLSVEFWICLFLSLSLALVYWELGRSEFINFDDSVYVYENPNVRNGISLKNVVWAFLNTYPCWQPLAWLSHMLDCHTFGLNAGWHHFTNLLFHILNSTLLFFVFRKMTGDVWKSFVVAALFALHPLSVDSVAWISERKSVLSSFWWILTMWFYAHYAEKPCLMRYLWALLFFVLGLLTKPFVITLPFVLLLLDYWPLGQRWARATIDPTGNDHRIVFTPLKNINLSRRVMEKVPFFILLAVYLSVFSITLAEAGTASMGKVPLGLRMANALVSYGKYFLKAVFPHNLSVFYPFPDSIPVWQIAVSTLLIVGVSILSIRLINEKPYIFTGWFWFLGTLVPVIGLIQSGLWPAMADRWMYIPQIGLYIVVVWGIVDLFRRMRFNHFFLVLPAALILLLLSIVTWHQVKHWRSNITLFQHAIDVTVNNIVAYNNLGNALIRAGRYEEAIRNLEKAIAIQPKYAYAQYSLGLALYHQGNIEKATRRFLKTLELDPSFFRAHYNLGLIYYRQGRHTEAVRHYRSALRLENNYADTHNNLGLILHEQGRYAEAAEHYLKATEIAPDHAIAFYNLGNLMLRIGKIDAAIHHFTTALRLHPAYPDAHNNLATAYVQKGDLNKAVWHYKAALRLAPNHSDARENLKKIRK